ncbi:MAG: restriction endonuclease subunit S [bacterium]|nr:restriction endonuclease subunit S [bacterium]
MKKLGEVVSITKGQLITESDAVPGDIPVIGGGTKPSYYHNRPNRVGKTITISASGANAGFVAFHDTPIFASDCSTISEQPSYSTEFIYAQLLHKQALIFKSQTGGAQPHVHANDLNPLEIGCPPLPEQTAIAEVLSDMDAELAILEKQREKTKELKQGMMQELLTGRIRLV